QRTLSPPAFTELLGQRGVQGRKQLKQWGGWTMNTQARGKSRTASVVAAKFAARAILVQDDSHDPSRRLIHKVAADCRIELKTVKSEVELETELPKRKADLVLVSSESRRAAALCDLVRESSGVRTAVVGL